MVLSELLASFNGSTIFYRTVWTFFKDSNWALYILYMMRHPPQRILKVFLLLCFVLFMYCMFTFPSTTYTHTHIYSHLVLAALSEQLSISDLGDGLNCFEQFLTSRIMVSHCLPHHVHHPIVYKDTVSIHMPHVTEIIQAPENKYNKIFGKIRSDTSSHSCKQY